MLSVQEFTAGALESAAPLSLILARTKHEATILIGQIGDRPAAIFLSGQHAFYSFESAGNRSWRGLIVPDVNVEVDEASAFDPDRDEESAGVLIRSDTRLIALGRGDQAFGGWIPVVLYADLPAIHDARVAFSKWQVVIGTGVTKRILTKVDVRRSAAT